MTVHLFVSAEEEQGFQLKLFCECSQSTLDSTFSFSISGTTNGRGDTAILTQKTQQPPYILTMSIPKNVSTQLSSRKKRSTEAEGACTE